MHSALRRGLSSAASAGELPAYTAHRLAVWERESLRAASRLGARAAAIDVELDGRALPATAMKSTPLDVLDAAGGACPAPPRVRHRASHAARNAQWSGRRTRPRWSSRLWTGNHGTLRARSSAAAR